MEILEGLGQKSSSGYLEKCSPAVLMYVPIDTNPADITTRLLSPNTFVSCEMWLMGPDFLHLENIDMPCQNFLKPGEFLKNRR